ncbi:hypothetical protein [Azospirillum argentinense]|uniref:Uncharacterized protein n=1 Tax=Azospirillum argentinense TaxID=2970906 RepID=A0A5B0KKN2_9PROT|nr:hypothetical protein [Azospirillum argentinense]KAA1052495.1 hypothetical protein FH063_004272 [Azospirillum argentinense]
MTELLIADRAKLEHLDGATGIENPDEVVTALRGGCGLDFHQRPAMLGITCTVSSSKARRNWPPFASHWRVQS